MIFGIGTDLIEITRIEKLLLLEKTKFLNKIYSDKEIAQGLTKKISTQVAFFAKRFAAKEAVAKSIGTGIAKGISFKEIEIYNNLQGKPNVRLLGKTRMLVKDILNTDNYKIDLSLSDTQFYALAYAVISAK